MGRRRGTSAFPVARIKKMMQSDDDVGKIATVTPVLVAKSLELMMQYVLEEAAAIALRRNTKTVTPQHLKTCVMNNDSFDFLRDVLKGVTPLEERVKDPGRARPRAPQRMKRPRSPKREGERVRRVRRAKDDAPKLHTPKAHHAVAEHDQPDAPAATPPDAGGEMLVERAVQLARPDNTDEEDDYDDDADAEHGEPDRAEGDPGVDPRSPNGRMSVSALLS